MSGPGRTITIIDSIPQPWQRMIVALMEERDQAKADLQNREVLAALPEVQALIAEAEEAADAIDMAYGDPHDEGTPHRYSAKLRAAIAAIRKRGEG